MKYIYDSATDRDFHRWNEMLESGAKAVVAGSACLVIKNVRTFDTHIKVHKGEGVFIPEGKWIEDAKFVPYADLWEVLIAMLREAEQMGCKNFKLGTNRYNDLIMKLPNDIIIKARTIKEGLSYKTLYNTMRKGYEWTLNSNDISRITHSIGEWQMNRAQLVPGRWM